MHSITRRDSLKRLTLGLAALEARAAEPLNFAGKPIELALASVGGNTLRVTVTAAGEARSLPPDNALALAAPVSPLLHGRSAGDLKSVRWGQLQVVCSAAPLAIEVRDNGGKALQRLQFDASSPTVSFRNSSGPLFGLGEGGEQFDRRNQQFSMRNGQFEPGRRVEGARFPLPWVVSADGWAIFFHQPFGKMNLSGENGSFTAEENGSGLPLDLFVVLSREPAEVMKAYADITGYPHMPPLWSLGYQQSHRTLESRAEVMDEAKRFRDDKLPCDAMIYLGTGFCPSGWNTDHGSFQFNEKVFPDPAKMFEELHREHFHVILHLTRPPLQLRGTVADKGAEAQDANDAAHYWATHVDVFRLGVDGWWPDEGDGLSPASRLARNRMYWEGPLRERPNQRPWALHRNGYAGLQRYGWLWSGDINSDWKAFAAQIPVGLNTGLSGIPYWGTDTGGFVPTKEYTGELYVRWFQFSAFTPLFRSHGRTWKLHLPWQWNTGESGPVEADVAPDPNELHNAQVEPICQKYLDLRYRMLPYIYSAVRESHDTGMPLMRALWLHYPGDARASSISDQYLWGRDIMVAPVIEKGAASRRVYLPAGSWRDFWSGETVEGGKDVDAKTPLDTIPLYVRAGAILPLGPVKQYVTENVNEPLAVRVYPGADGRFNLYEDDGESFAYERGEFMRIVLQWTDASRQLRLSLAPGSKMLGASPREIMVESAAGGSPQGFEPKRLRFSGSPVTVQL